MFVSIEIITIEIKLPDISLMNLYLPLIYLTKKSSRRTKYKKVL